MLQVSSEVKDVLTLTSLPHLPRPITSRLATLDVSIEASWPRWIHNFGEAGRARGGARLVHGHGVPAAHAL